MVDLIALTQVSKLQKRQEIGDNKVVIYIEWQSSYCGRHTGIPYFMLSAQSATKKAVKKLGGGGEVHFISIWLHVVHPAVEMGREMILLREGGRMEQPSEDWLGDQRWALSRAQQLIFAITVVWGRAPGRASPHLSLGVCPLPQHPSLLPEPGLVCNRNGTPPPCSSAGYGQDGNKIKRKKDFFFPSCILATAPTQRSKYKIFYPPPFQAISMLKCRKKQDGDVKTET